MRSKQLIDGKLVDPVNNCLYIALESYRKRHTIDTNPCIVQMIIDDFIIIPHWYYRSDEWIEQNFLIPKQSIMPYNGPAKSASKTYYGSFEKYADLMRYLPENIEGILNAIPKEILID